MEERRQEQESRYSPCDGEIEQDDPLEVVRPRGAEQVGGHDRQGEVRRQDQDQQSLGEVQDTHHEVVHPQTAEYRVCDFNG